MQTLTRHHSIVLATILLATAQFVGYCGMPNTIATTTKTTTTTTTTKTTTTNNCKQTEQKQQPM